MLGDFRGIQLPAANEFVLVDTITADRPVQGPIQRIPLMMWIDYAGMAPNPPTVTLLINPATMSSSFSKKVNASFTRGGFVVETWGENLDVLQMSGTIGGYYVLGGSTDTGLNRYDRSKSYSFRNLMEVFLIYRNNGAIFLNSYKNINNNTNKSTIMEGSGYPKVDARIPNSLKTVKTRVASMGSVYLQYDKTLYYGSFDTLSIEEDANKPYSLNYSFSFTVLRRNIVDNRSTAYYNQVALEFEDYKINRKSTDLAQVSDVVDNYIRTEASTKSIEAQTNPATFKTNVSAQDRPSRMLDHALNLLDTRGYQTNAFQNAAYYNSFVHIENVAGFKELQQVKDNIYDNTYNIVNGQSTQPDAEKARDARELANTITDYNNYLKGGSR